MRTSLAWTTWSRRALAGTLAWVLGLSSLGVGATDARAAQGLVVVTRAGDVFGGTLIEIVSGDHVSLRLSTGEVRVIPWADVKSTTMTDDGEPASITSSTSSTSSDSSTASAITKLGASLGIPGLPFTALAPPYEGPDAVEVLLDSEEGDLSDVKLYAATDDAASRWEPICTWPCRLRVDPRRVYRVSGFAIEPSAPFHLDGDGPRQVLEVQPAWSGKGAFGWTFFLLGAAMVGGGLYWYTRAPSEDAAANDITAKDSRMTDHLGGAIILGTGLPFLVIGLAVLGSRGETTVTGRKGERLASSPTLPLGGGTWLTPSGLAF